MKLSKHFDSREFDCKCGNCGGLGEYMNPTLINLLEKLRDDCGGYPLKVNSAYRCYEHNLAVGGASQSQHMYHTAADIACPWELSYDEFYHACLECELNGKHFDGVGYYPDSNFVHVDVRYNGYGPRVTW